MVWGSNGVYMAAKEGGKFMGRTMKDAVIAYMKDKEREQMTEPPTGIPFDTSNLERVIKEWPGTAPLPPASVAGSSWSANGQDRPGEEDEVQIVQERIRGWDDNQRPENTMDFTRLRNDRGMWNAPQRGRRRRGVKEDPLVRP